MRITAGTSGIAKIISAKKKPKTDKKKLKVASMVYACECCQNQY